MIDLSCLVHTADAAPLAKTAADLRATDFALHEGLKKHGLTRYKPVGREANFVARNRIDGWHQTHMPANPQTANFAHGSRQVPARQGRLRLFPKAHHDTVTRDRRPVTFSNVFPGMAALSLPEAAE